MAKSKEQSMFVKVSWPNEMSQQQILNAIKAAVNLYQVKEIRQELGIKIKLHK